jgi:hypothetical protein
MDTGASTESVVTPWQRAVYTRAGVTDLFTFSHIEFTTVAKQFPCSLCVQDMARAGSTRSANLEALQQAVVLILVTGKWAQHLSLDNFAQTGGRGKQPVFTLYDHMDRLCHGATRTGNKHCAELTLDYKALQYHSTLCHYTKGDDHSWRLFSVVPVLSDSVILPRLLEPSRIKTAMAGFSRASRKCMRDSLIMAGGAKYKENSMCKIDDKNDNH